MAAEEQIRRIREMEAALNEARAAVRGFDEAMERYAAAQEAVRKLSAYYGSEDWKADFAADEAGELPRDLPRGVLSEDGIWDVLEENRELLARMLELSAQIVREG